MNRFIDQVADLFEPFSGVARVGYECLQGPDSWEVVLFLGENETVGGSQDGQLTPVNFRFDLQRLSACFSSLETLFWNAFPHSHVCFEEQGDLAFVTATGKVESHRVSLQIQAIPPEGATPGLRAMQDGRIELV
jgi:hypothetical protein